MKDCDDRFANVDDAVGKPCQPCAEHVFERYQCDGSGCRVHHDVCHTDCIPDETPKAKDTPAVPEDLS